MSKMTNGTVSTVFWMAAVLCLGTMGSEHISVEENASALSGYDTGLTHIAQGSARQAHSAVHHQQIAGQQASFLAKSTLAQAASQASATAHAALAGKQALLHTFEEVNEEALAVFKGELIQLRQAKQAAATANSAAQKAAHHVTLLTKALNSAQEGAYIAQETQSHAVSELASQTAMVAKAKARLEAIEHELGHARSEYQATKEAAEKALASAHEAQNNAAIAGAHASIELHEAAAAAGAAAVGADHLDDHDHLVNSVDESHSGDHAEHLRH